MTTNWLSVEEFADAAGIGRRSATAALSRAKDGAPWRGFALEVRRTQGRGGRSGTVYQVSLRSLSAALGKAVPDQAEPAQLLDVAARGDGTTTAAVRAAAEAAGLSERTAWRKLALVKSGGHVATLRKTPSNAGQPRVAISRDFTRFALAAGWTEAQTWVAHDQVKQFVRALWITPAANAGARRIAGRARDYLQRELAPDLAERATPAEARQVFNIPRRFVEAERTGELLHRKRTDAKAHYDARPGALRDLNLCRPMEVVFGDVHHLDVKMRRENGEEAFCVKMVAFMDVGNRRVFAKFFNMPKGRMIRQDHVAETFALMALHPEFGMAQNLYIDNGSEYRMFDHMVEAFRLMGVHDHGGSLIHSTAYNPRGKAALESFFQHFERYYLSMLPGYAGGDRQRQKTANQGKAIAAAPWPWELAERALEALLDRYNRDPRPVLGDRSPAEVFAADPAWKPVTVSLEALAYGHAKRRPAAVVRQGLVRVEGRDYRVPGPAMLAERVTVLHSNWMVDSVVIEHEGALLLAPLAQRRHMLDRDGAREAAALTASFNREIEQLGAGLPSIDPVRTLLAQRPDVLDLLPGPKAAIGQAISPKARRTAEAEDAAWAEAKDAERFALLAQFSGPKNPVRKSA